MLGTGQAWRPASLAGRLGDPRFLDDDGRAPGRLTRVRCQGSDIKSAAYIVAAADPDQAMTIMRSVTGTNAAIEDLGRVSNALMRSLGLLSGEFIRIDKVNIYRGRRGAALRRGPTGRFR